MSRSIVSSPQLVPMKIKILVYEESMFFSLQAYSLRYYEQKVANFYKNVTNLPHAKCTSYGNVNTHFFNLIVSKLEPFHPKFGIGLFWQSRKHHTKTSEHQPLNADTLFYHGRYWCTEQISAASCKMQYLYDLITRQVVCIEF